MRRNRRHEKRLLLSASIELRARGVKVDAHFNRPLVAHFDRIGPVMDRERWR